MNVEVDVIHYELVSPSLLSFISELFDLLLSTLTSQMDGDWRDWTKPVRRTLPALKIRAVRELVSVKRERNESHTHTHTHTQLKHYFNKLSTLPLNSGLESISMKKVVFKRLHVCMCTCVHVCPTGRQQQTCSTSIVSLDQVIKVMSGST